MYNTVTVGRIHPGLSAAILRAVGPKGGVSLITNWMELIQLDWSHVELALEAKLLPISWLMMSMSSAPVSDKVDSFHTLLFFCVFLPLLGVRGFRAYALLGK